MTEPTTPTPNPSTWRSRRAWVVLLVTLVVGLFLDIWTKYEAFARIASQPVEVRREDVLRLGPRSLGAIIPPHEPVVVVPQVLELTLVLNPGAVFGIGAGKRWFFVFFTLVAVVFGLWLFAKWTRPRDWLAHSAVGLILAGGLGNLYDRLVYACVRDFLHPLPHAKLPFGWSWPGGSDMLWPYVSNVADAFLIVGVAVLVVHSWRVDARAKGAR